MSTTDIQNSALKIGTVANIKTWWCALRPESFPVSAVPALLGVAIAWSQGYRIDLLLAVLTAVGAVAIHAATNLLQDYFDFRSGLDREGTLGGSGVLVGGLRSPRAILIASSVFYVVSAVLAAYLIYMSGLELTWIVAAGVIVGSGYAVPKYGLKYNLLGDIGVFAAFGIGITMGSYFIQTGRFDITPLYYAVPFGLLVVALLHANNMRDAHDDFEAGLRNPAFRMGSKLSRAFYILLILGAYALPATFVSLGLVPRGVLVVLVTLPLALKLMERAIETNLGDREALGPQVIHTALMVLIFGIVMVIGVVANKALFG